MIQLWILLFVILLWNRAVAARVEMDVVEAESIFSASTGCIRHNCSGHGKCNLETGKCKCDDGYSSDDCSSSSRVQWYIIIFVIPICFLCCCYLLFCCFVLLYVVRWLYKDHKKGNESSPTKETNVKLKGKTSRKRRNGKARSKNRAKEQDGEESTTSTGNSTTSSESEEKTSSEEDVDLDRPKNDKVADSVSEDFDETKQAQENKLVVRFPLQKGFEFKQPGEGDDFVTPIIFDHREVAPESDSEEDTGPYRNGRRKLHKSSSSSELSSSDIPTDDSCGIIYQPEMISVYTTSEDESHTVQSAPSES